MDRLKVGVGPPFCALKEASRYDLDQATDLWQTSVQLCKPQAHESPLEGQPPSEQVA